MNYITYIVEKLEEQNSQMPTIIMEMKTLNYENDFYRGVNTAISHLDASRFLPNLEEQAKRMNIEIDYKQLSENLLQSISYLKYKNLNIYKGSGVGYDLTQVDPKQITDDFI